MSPSRYKDFYAPWEHPVCPTCLEKNRYALHLVLAQCLKPHAQGRERHPANVRVPAFIDPKQCALTQVRPLHWYIYFRGPYVKCWNKPPCRRGSSCPYPHSDFEKETWTIKKKVLTRLGKSARGMLCSMRATSFPLVCKQCYEQHDGAVWLMWLVCTDPEGHNGSVRVRVAKQKNKDYIRCVREPPSCTSLQTVQLCPQNSNCVKDCEKAHSEEEYDYWKFHHIQNLFRKCFVGDFNSFCKQYAFPGDPSALFWMNIVKQKLSVENYSLKFRAMLYLDEIEQSRKMIKECDSQAQLRVRRDAYGATAELHDLNSAAIDYSTFHGGEVFVKSKHGVSSSSDFSRGPGGVLLLNDLPQHFLDKCLRNQEVHVHFEINFRMYRNMYTSLEKVPHFLLEKLLPTKSRFQSTSKEVLQRLNYNKLDREYQSKALVKIVKNESTVPFLVLGPFGTGKTRLLVTVAYNLLRQSGTKLLVCTHMNRGADYFCEHYCEIASRLEPPFRLVPTAEAGLKTVVPQQAFVILPRNLHGSERLIVTTFNTAFHLSFFDRSVTFSHILIDEGAQSVEPEVICALVAANRDTQIVIAGDNQQVGPPVRVASSIALENGLGTSLLQRMYGLYKKVKGAQTKHTATLLTNYRCHPSILMLCSSLFYEHTLLTRSESKAHPRYPYPLVFACSSLEQGSMENCRGRNQQEAELLIDHLLLLLDELPEEWRQQERAKGYINIGVLASTKDQVSLLRRKFYDRNRNPQNIDRVSILPTYNIQGEEFLAIFMSTVEPQQLKARSGMIPGAIAMPMCSILSSQELGPWYFV